jgi:hypothetical protein
VGQPVNHLCAAANGTTELFGYLFGISDVVESQVRDQDKIDSLQVVDLDWADRVFLQKRIDENDLPLTVDNAMSRHS